MKKGIVVLSFTLIALLAGCSIINSPKVAVQRFAKAIEKNDTKAMAKVATPETVQLISMFGSKMQGMANANGKVKKVTETISGDTATVNVVFENDEEMDFDLIKVDGQWKVDINFDMGK